MRSSQRCAASAEVKRSAARLSLGGVIAFPSKAALKIALNAGHVRLHEPSIMGSWTKPASDLPVGFRDVVTNHPLRTKFATIERRQDGWRVT